MSATSIYTQYQELIYHPNHIHLQQMELTPKCIQKMLKNESASNQLLIVEGKKLGKSKGAYLSLLVSDGETTARSVVDSETCGKGLLEHLNDDRPLRLMIHEFTIHKWQRKKIIEIRSLTILESKSSIK